MPKNQFSKILSQGHILFALDPTSKQQQANGFQQVLLASTIPKTMEQRCTMRSRQVGLNQHERTSWKDISSSSRIIYSLFSSTSHHLLPIVLQMLQATQKPFHPQSITHRSSPTFAFTYCRSSQVTWPMMPCIPICNLSTSLARWHGPWIVQIQACKTPT